MLDVCLDFGFLGVECAAMKRYVLVLILLSSCAIAETTAETLAIACNYAVQNDQSKFSVQMKQAAFKCAGYVSGILDDHQLFKAALQKHEDYSLLSMFYCAPNDLQPIDVAKIFLSYLNDHENLKLDAAANVIVLGLREKYRCK
jgi:hypothetical protein